MILSLAGLLCSALLIGAEVLPQIRFTEQNPFANGKRVEKVWRKADVMTRFISSAGLDAVSDQSEVSALYDAKNLYLSVRGFYQPKQFNSYPDKSLFANNNFEIFLRMDPSGKYVQIAVDDLGRVYTAFGRAETKLPGLKVKIQKGPNFWTANLTIPFADLKTVPPVADKTVKLGVMRNNISTYDKNRKPAPMPRLRGIIMCPISGLMRS
jgi:hypothetical protein